MESQISYEAVGSGAGKDAIINDEVDFAGSDSLITEEQYMKDHYMHEKDRNSQVHQKGSDLVMLPVLASAVVPVYHISGISANDSNLVLDRKTLADIFMGTVRRWDDDAILATNPQLAPKLKGLPMRLPNCPNHLVLGRLCHHHPFLTSCLPPLYLPVGPLVSRSVEACDQQYPVSMHLVARHTLHVYHLTRR